MAASSRRILIVIPATSARDVADKPVGREFHPRGFASAAGTGAFTASARPLCLLPHRRGEFRQGVGGAMVAGLGQFHGAAKLASGGVSLAAFGERLAEQEMPLADLGAELHEATEQRQPLLRLT